MTLPEGNLAGFIREIAVYTGTGTRLRLVPRSAVYDLPMLPSVTPQLLGNAGLRPLRLAIADPDRYAIEGKVDGVRGLVTFDEGGRRGTPISRGRLAEERR
jgi:hypothetical protein